MHGSPGAACNCLWRGNEANPGTIVMDGATIEDALFAARLYGGSTLSAKNVHFNNNFVGVRATNGAFTLSGFDRNIFDASGPLRDACTLLPRTSEITWANGTPVTYSTARGYSGIYVNNIGALNLTTLVPARQNLFRNLVVGIQSFNTNLKVERNSRFVNIEAVGYPQPTPIPLPGYVGGAAAVRFIDSPLAGSNSCRVIGNIAQPFLPPIVDFDDCAIGVHLISSVQGDGATGTRIHIANCTMTDMQTGILLLTGEASGTLAGGGTGSSRGVFSNRINSNRTFTNQLSDITGIFIADQSPTTSSLQIYQNTVSVTNPLGNGISMGIRIAGSLQNSLPVVQIDVHRNAVTIEQFIIAAIGASDYRSAWIHDNSSSAAQGAGIFMNGNGALNFSGILFRGGEGNLAGCNDVTTSGSTSQTSNLLFSAAHTDGIIVKNHLFAQGPTINGLMHFNANNGLATQIICNTMQGNGGDGLEYDNNTQTGDQGQGLPNPATNGNRWLGAFTWGAVGLLSAPMNSRFFVRHAPTYPEESPSVPTQANGWFSESVPDNILPVACDHYICPLTAPLLPPPAIIREQETEVAAGTLQYDHYPLAYTWWNEHNLYRKLLRTPALLQGNILRQNFFAAKSGTASGQVVGAVSAADNLFLISNVQQPNIANLLSQIDVLNDQVSWIDSTLNQTVDSSQLMILQGQRSQKMDSLQVKQVASQMIFEQIAQQHLSATPSVISLIGAITPTNAFETNLKTVLGIQVRFTALGAYPSAGELTDLANIGSECPFVAGPAKYTARTLYTRFTGTELPETPCPPGFTSPENEDRSQQLQQATDFAIYPNPAIDRLEVRYESGGASWLNIENSLGQQVMRLQIQQSGQAVDISALIPGCYVVRLEKEEQNFIDSYAHHPPLIFSFSPCRVVVPDGRPA